MNPIVQDAVNFVDTAVKLGIKPFIPILAEGPTDREVTVDGERRLFFSSNNYLGLANHPKIIAELVRATNKYGFGSGASRLVGGTFDSHVLLEKEIARFKGGEAAMIFSTGSIANDTTIPALLNAPALSARSYVSRLIGGERSAVFSDDLNHASIVDGCRLAKAEKNIYKHNDLDDLERQLRKSRAKKKLIVTDSVFSMDGDVADVRSLISLKEKYGASLYVDEAHSTGVFGVHGRGVSEEYGIEGIDIKMGTFSKAFGGAGGFVVASKEIIEYLKLSCRKYIFSTAMPPAQAAALVVATKEVEGAVEERKHLKDISAYLRGEVKKQGFSTLGSTTQIVPIVIGGEKETMQLSQLLRKKQIEAPAVIWPATPRNQGRLRVSLISHHTKEDVDRLIGALKEVS